MNHFMNNAKEYERKKPTSKQIVRDLEQIDKLLEDDSPLMAKERINFLINDITKGDSNWHGEYQGRTQRQVENNYKVLGLSVLGLLVAIISIIIYGLITV